MGEPRALRTFIALPLPLAARETLHQARQRLEAVSAGGVRWVEPEHFHLTLKFLGNTPVDQLAAIAQAMEETARVSRAGMLQLSRLGAFPATSRPRVLWAGLEGDLGAVADLYQRLERALQPLGFPRDERPFAAHVTLGRVRDDARGGAAAQRLASAFSQVTLPHPALPFPAGEVVFFRSTVTPSGPIYTPIAASPIGTRDR